MKTNTVGASARRYPAILAAAALALSGVALAQQARTGDPFVDDAEAGYHFRTYYFDRDNPDRSTNEAWAIGGWLYGRTGYWRDFLQLGLTGYFSMPLYAPDDKDGTTLLEPWQKGYGVIGEAYARMRYAGQHVTLYRQEVNMSAPRASGVRGNRSDGTYVGRQDNRLSPLTYEAAIVNGPIDESLRYWAGYLWNVKPRNDTSFISMGAQAGARSSDSGMWMGGLQWQPIRDTWVQGWYHQVPDVIGIAWLDLDHVNRLSKESYFRAGTQYTDQRAVGSNLLTGSDFSTWNWAAYGEYGWKWLTLYGAYSTTGKGQQLRNPYTSGPIYTQQLIKSFIRAGEDAWQIGASVSADQLANGLSTFLDYTDGSGAVDPANRSALPDAYEYNVGMAWRYSEKGSIFDGFTARLRYGWAYDEMLFGKERTTNTRFEINWLIPFK